MGTWSSEIGWPLVKLLEKYIYSRDLGFLINMSFESQFYKKNRLHSLRKKKEKKENKSYKANNSWRAIESNYLFPVSTIKFVIFRADKVNDCVGTSFFYRVAHRSAKNLARHRH